MFLKNTTPEGHFVHQPTCASVFHPTFAQTIPASFEWRYPTCMIAATTSDVIGEVLRWMNERSAVE